MDHFQFGRLIGEIEHRLEAIETEWRTIKHYGRRGIVLAALGTATALSHLNAQQVAMWLKSGLDLMRAFIGG
jgi:hypothetical protein